MTINQALALCSSALNDTVPEETLLSWLWEIESTVICEIASTHSGSETELSPITPGCDRDRVLFVPDPMSELYVSHAVMKNCLRLGDMQKYLNCAAVFASAYSSFADSYNRSHMPAGEKSISI